MKPPFVLPVLYDMPQNHIIQTIQTTKQNSACVCVCVHLHSLVHMCFLLCTYMYVCLYSNNNQIKIVTLESGAFTFEGFKRGWV